MSQSQQDFEAQIREVYPGQISLTITQFSAIVLLKPASIRSMMSRGQLKIDVFKSGSGRGARVHVPISAAAAYLATLTKYPPGTLK